MTLTGMQTPQRPTAAPASAIGAASPPAAGVQWAAAAGLAARALAAALVILTLLSAAARADGILIPEPPFGPFSIRYHRVQVEIDDQAARTAIDQVFHNPEPRDLEATYLFPLPEGASFSAFSMYLDGEPLHAEILPADEARRIYEEIVRQRIDPALLEYVGRGAYRARIFPVPAEGDRRVELAYDEVLRRDAGIVRYVYPLNTEKFSAEPLEDVSVQVTIRSTAPIRSVYSPSHDIVVDRTDDHQVRVIYADEGVLPNQDFVLYYTVSADPVGIDVLTHLGEGDDEGYYLLLAAPQVDPVTDNIIPKRMVYVLDRSGSMVGEKMEQATAALRFAVNSMRPEDTFGLVDYGTTVESLSNGVLQASPEARAQALAYLDGLQATGGTNIEGALLAAAALLGDDEVGVARMIVFLTDGRPTIGQTDTDRLVAQVTEALAGRARLFVFGVGLEVNTHLLDRLAGDNGGTSTYVTPEQDIEVAVSAFYEKVSSPVLTDLDLQFSGAQTRDVYPQALPDLFRGSQVVQLGRIAWRGPAAVRLSGTIVGQTVTFERPVPEGDGGADFLPRLWATRKVGFLLDQIRLNGEDPELVEEIVGLSRRYGIITPYTSFLIVEDEPSVPIGDDPGLHTDSGADAVRAAQDVAEYAGARNTEATRSEQVRYAGDKTFYWREGVWRDSQYDDALPTRSLAFGSPAYFDLVRQRPELGPYLAVGTRVLLRAGADQYEVGDTATAVTSPPPLPAQARLAPTFPNPFNPATTIRFELERAGAVTLVVYDAAGRRVRTLVEVAPYAAAAHEVTWDGRDDDGAPVASGVYVAALRVGGAQQTRKMVLMK